MACLHTHLFSVSSDALDVLLLAVLSMASGQIQKGQIQRVSVTGTKRKEDVQNVPISILAVSGGALEKPGMIGPTVFDGRVHVLPRSGIRQWVIGRRISVANRSMSNPSPIPAVRCRAS